MKYIKERIPYIVILTLVILVRTFIVTPVIVDGDSMDETLKNGEVLLLKKYDKTYERNEIVVLNYSNEKLIKRVIGLPGESVLYHDGILYINGKEVEDKFGTLTYDFTIERLGVETIPEGYYFVLGDNRKNSSDSRIIGLVSENDIIGTTTFSLWPLKNIK